VRSDHRDRLGHAARAGSKVKRDLLATAASGHKANPVRSDHREIRVRLVQKALKAPQGTPASAAMLDHKER
jgi:hypothetical protein